MLNESLEKLEKEMKDSKTIREYLLSRIYYYDLCIYLLKQKITNLKKITPEENNYFREQFNYYDACRRTASIILSELIELNLKEFTK